MAARAKAGAAIFFEKDIAVIDYSQAFHTGVLVTDLDAAMDFYSRTLGLRFAEPFTLEGLPVWTPEQGLTTITNRFTISCDGPLRLELQQGQPGSFFDGALSRGDHVGLWVDDVAASVESLLAEGWTVIAAGAAPEDCWGPFAYLEPEAGGMVVELASRAMRPAFERWWQGGPLRFD